MTDIFISYSHKDEAWKDALKQQLQVLQLHTEFTVWDDRQIQMGDNWKPAIEQAISRAKIVILLVSSDFLASEFVTCQEIPKFLQRREQDGLRIVPVILRPCAWRTVYWLENLQGATKDNKPLSMYTLGSFELEQVFSEITEKVHSLLLNEIENEQIYTLHLNSVEENSSVKTIDEQNNKSLELSKPTDHFSSKQLITHSNKNHKVLIIITIILILSIFSWWFITKIPLFSEPEVIPIPPGSFSMGCNKEKTCQDDERPIHKVTIQAFSVGKYEVTFKDWAMCVINGGCQHKPEKWWRGKFPMIGRLPIVGVSWNDTQEYVQWLKKKTGKNYRLLTEAE